MVIENYLILHSTHLDSSPYLTSSRQALRCQISKKKRELIAQLRVPYSSILVTGNKYPNIEVIRRPFGQFSPKLPLLTVFTDLQWMSYL